MIVMKFGGSSVADTERILRVRDIVLSRKERVLVVLSAMKGVTDLLIEAARRAEAGDREYARVFSSIQSRHDRVIADLARQEGQVHYDQARTDIEVMLSELHGILRGIELIRECSSRTMDLVMSFGERMSCIVMAACILSSGRKVRAVDTRELIVTDDGYGGAVVDFGPTNSKIRNQLEGEQALPVITGFIGATPGGVTTTLGRNGSDYTAAIIGGALGAECIEIWTDVDGVLSADPRYVPEAFVVPAVNFQEAMELSYFGAEVIHPYTMIPAVENNIPIRIKNTMNPGAPGTLIAERVEHHGNEITGIASIESVALINVEGSGMMGVPGVAYRVFSAISKAGVNVIMISQASSEHSICLVCGNTEADMAVSALEIELSYEITARRIQRIEAIRDLEIVAVIGENMRGRPGISGKLFSALGDAGINVLAIAQGSSERNISFVIDGAERRHALRTVHETFFSPAGNIGVSTVGQQPEPLPIWRGSEQGREGRDEIYQHQGGRR